MNENRLEWNVALLLATFALVNALSWANVIPLGEAPDEAGHFEVVAFESVYWRIPEFGVDDYGVAARVAVDGYNTPYYSYSPQPGLSYLASAAAINLLEGIAATEPARAARYPGAIWAALMTIVTFVGAREMFGSERGAAVLAATVVSCWPQLTLVFAYTNNDGLTTLVCAAVVAAWYFGRRAGWRIRDSILLGFFCGLVLLGKPNGFVLVPTGFAVLLLTSREATSEDRLRRVGIAGATMSLTGGWWYLEAYRRYGWDLFASGRAEQMREALGVEWASARHFGMGFIETAFGEYPRYGEPWMVGTLRSSFGVLGQMAAHLNKWSYVLVAALTITALAGALFVWLKRRSGRLDFTHCITFMLIPALLTLSLYRSWTFDYQAQGRYLFPAMLPFAALVAFGVVAPFRGAARGVAGFVASVVFFGLIADAFMVRLLRLYDQAYGDFHAANPVLALLWVLVMLTAFGSSTLYWLRIGSTGSANPE